MDKQGTWTLAPAYDVTYSHNPAGLWTNQHQMSINNKRNHFEKADFLALANAINLPHAEEEIKNIIDVVSRWPEFAKEAGLNNNKIREIQKYLRLQLA